MRKKECKDKQKKSGKRRALLIFIDIIVAAVVIYAGIYIYKQYHGDKTNDEIKKQVKVETKKEPEEKETNPIDFDELHQINEDIYAWIQIPDTQIDYPVLQKEGDDAYYLNHTVDNISGLPGSIYTEDANSKDFSDYNTIIYGHNMKNGSMFSGLHKFEDNEYVKEHETYFIYLPDRKLTYEVLATCKISDDHLLYKYDFSSTDGRDKFIEDIKRDGSYFDSDMTIDQNSKLVTLSTCVGGQADKRWIVVGILKDELIYEDN